MIHVRPALAATPRFDLASREILDYLQHQIPLATWAVTRYDGEHQAFLTVEGAELGLTPGMRVDWSNSLCQYSAVRTSPTFITDVDCDPRYSALVRTSNLPIRSYVGYPLTTADGSLFGTICGFGSDLLTDGTDSHGGLIVLLASLLARVLEADLQATAAARRLEAEQRRADTDALTGLTNRAGWQRLLDSEESRFRRFGDQGTVIIIDLDDLKEVNDSSGHHAGDDLLRRTARLMSDVIGEPGMIARIGGDEFAILLPDVTTSTVRDVVVQLKTTMARRGVSASLGYAPYAMSDGLDSAWREADAAMYAEKSEKNRSRDSAASRAGLTV